MSIDCLISKYDCVVIIYCTDDACMHACIDREDAVLAMMILVSAGGMLAVLYCEKEPQSHSDITPMLICWLLACMHCDHPSFTQEVYSIIA